MAGQEAALGRKERRKKRIAKRKERKCRKVGKERTDRRQNIAPALVCEMGGN